MALDEGGEWICHEVIDVGFVGFTASLTIMCNYVRFDVHIDIEDLGQPPSEANNPLVEEFVGFRDNFDEDVEAFEDWAVSPCLPFFRRLAPAPKVEQTFTLDDYYRPPTHLLRLKSCDGALIAEENKSQSRLPEALRPRLSISDPRLASDAFRALPQIPASKLNIVRELQPTDFEFCAVPRVVCNGRLGSKLAFKELVDEESFFRELEVYLITQQTQNSRIMHLPTLHGLVTLGDGMILGFLLEHIEHDGTLQYHADTASTPDREKWYRQIEQALGHLHKSGCCWGDVKPDNVLIDLNGYAHIIDFGGGYATEWVDEKVAGTKAGDLQGLERLKSFLG